MKYHHDASAKLRFRIKHDLRIRRRKKSDVANPVGFVGKKAETIFLGLKAHNGQSWTLTQY